MAERKPSAESVLLARRNKANIIAVPTDMEGVSLRVEDGKKPHILRESIGKLAVNGALFAGLKAHLDLLEQQKKGPEAVIKATAQRFRGVRGVQSEQGNFKLNVNPRHTLAWDPDILHESLGLKSSSVISNALDVAISLPEGHETNQGPLTRELLKETILRGLVELGLPEAELSPMVDPTVVTTVNEDRLTDLLLTERVNLLRGAGVVTNTTWAITVDPLRKP
jgi:hypothetical protein